MISISDVVVTRWKWAEFPSVEVEGTYMRAGRRFDWTGTCAVNGGSASLVTLKIQVLGFPDAWFTQEEKQLLADAIAATVNGR